MPGNPTAPPYRVAVVFLGHRGGPARTSLDLAQALHAYPDVLAHVVLTDRNVTLGEYGFLADRRYVMKGFETMRQLLVRSLGYPFQVIRVWRFLRRNEIDLVIFTMHNPWNPALMLLCRWRKRPFVYVVHDAELHSGENTFVRRALLHTEIAIARHFVCLTESVSQQFRRKFAVAQENVCVIRHGASRASGEVEREKRASPALRLLFFGRIARYKGLELLCEALQLLREASVPFQLRVVGDGPLPACLSGLRESQDVEVVNRFVSETEIEPLFRATDVLVAPYVDASQSGVIPLSFAFGVPAVCTPVGGLTEQVSHERNGLVAGRVDARAVADCLIELQRDPGLLARLSRGALHTASSELDWVNAIAPLVDYVRQGKAR